MTELVGLTLHLGEEALRRRAVATQVGLHPGDRVTQLPPLHVVVESVARRVVRGGVGAHPVGVGLHQGRALSLPGPLQRSLRDGVRRQHVVAVDTDAGEPETECALIERDPRLALDRLRDRPLVVLTEEDDRGVVGGREDEGLVDIALRRRTVAEVGDDRGVAGRVAGADDPVALHTHRIAGGVEGLGSDHDRVEPEVVVGRVPTTVIHPAEEAQ